MDIALPQRRNQTNTRRMAGPEDIGPILRDFLLKRMHPVDPDEITRLDMHPTLDDPRLNRPTKVTYELRSRKARFAEAGVVGHATHLILEGVFHYQFDSWLKELKSEQPGADWQLVAADIRAVDSTQSIETWGSGAQESDAFKQPAENSSPVELHNQVTTRVAPDISWHVDVVFADVAGGDVVDPNTSYGQKPGPMTVYAETRSLRSVSEGHRKQRERCVALIRKMYATGTTGTTPVPAPPVQLAPAPGIDVSQKGPSRDDLILGMRRSQVSFRQIADMLQLDIEYVKDVAKNAPSDQGMEDHDGT